MALKEPEGFIILESVLFKLERILEASWFSGCLKRGLKDTTLLKKKKRKGKGTKKNL